MPPLPSGDTGSDRFSARLKARKAHLFPTMAKVAAYLDHHRLEVLSRSAAELGRATQTSDATIVRTAKALGFSGLPELRRMLSEVMEVHRAAAGSLRTTLAKAGTSTAEMVDHVFAQELSHLSALVEDADQRMLILQAIENLGGADRILVFGHGLATSMAAYATTLLSRFGLQTLQMNARGYALIDQMLAMRRGDAAIVLAIGPDYPEMDIFLREARALGLSIVFVTDWWPVPPRTDGEVMLTVAQRKPGHVSLHGAYYVCLEAIALGLSALRKDDALSGLERLARLRTSLRTLEHNRDRWALTRSAPDTDEDAVPEI